MTSEKWNIVESGVKHDTLTKPIYGKWVYLMVAVQDINHLQRMQSHLLMNCLHFRSTWVHPPAFSGVRVTRSLVFFVMFFWSLFVLFLLSIVLSVILFTDSDYPFDILCCLWFYLRIPITSLWYIQILLAIR